MDNKKCTKIVVKSSKNIVHKGNNKSELKNTEIRDLQPILIVCQLFGMPPYSISKTNIRLSKIGIIYSSLIVIYNIFAVYKLVESVYNETMDKKLKYLIITRLMLLLLNICTDIIFSLLGQLKLQNLLKNTFYKEKFQKRGKSYFFPLSIILVIETIIFFLFIALLLPILFHKNNVLSYVLYITSNQATAFSILKFLSIVAVVRKKFQDLNSTLMKEISSKSEINTNKLCNLEDLWYSHEQLSTVIEELNCLFSMQLLFWILTIIFNIISRIYIFFTFKTVSVYLYTREILLLLHNIKLLVSLAIVCHITAEEVNKMSSIIFSPTHFRRRQQTLKKDNVIIFQYFLKQSFSFKAGHGLFVVNAQLLFYIAGATATYLVILVGPYAFSN